MNLQPMYKIKTEQKPRTYMLYMPLVSFPNKLCSSIAIVWQFNNLVLEKKNTFQKITKIIENEKNKMNFCSDESFYDDLVQ